MTTVRLVDDSGSTLLTLNEGSFAQPMLRKLDLGYPTPRESSTPSSGQDGEVDSTSLFGARGITAEILLTFDNPNYWVDIIRGLMHPGRRYWLHVQMDGWAAERRVRVRGASLALPMGPLPWDAQLGWRAPSPMLEDVTASTVTLSPTAKGTGGFAFPMTFPAAALPGLVPGASIIQITGTVPSLPVVDIYGPCSAPLFQVLDTGQSMSFPSLSIAAGDYLRIDCAARTINLNSDPAQSRYQALDFANSSWPSLPPGSADVVFSAASTSPSTVAVVTWRNAYL